jgi:hypothetical protein
VSAYDAMTGATVNSNFIYTGGSPLSPSFPTGMQGDANNHLFVCETNYHKVSVYNATTGAVVNPTLITTPSTGRPFGIALDGNNHLFVADWLANTIGEFNATTGAAINLTFVSGLSAYPISG